MLQLLSKELLHNVLIFLRGLRPYRCDRDEDWWLVGGESVEWCTGERRRELIARSAAERMISYPCADHVFFRNVETLQIARASCRQWRIVLQNYRIQVLQLNGSIQYEFVRRCQIEGQQGLPYTDTMLAHLQHSLELRSCREIRLFWLKFAKSPAVSMLPIIPTIWKNVSTCWRARARRSCRYEECIESFVERCASKEQGTRRHTSSSRLLLLQARTLLFQLELPFCSNPT